MKLNEITTLCREAQVDPRLAKILIALGERQAVQAQQLLDTAQTIDKIATALGKVLAVAGVMHEKMDSLKTKMERKDPEEFQ